MKTKLIYLIILLTITLIIIAVSYIYNKKSNTNYNYKSLDKTTSLNIKNKKMKNIEIIPLDFENGGFIPADFTCDGPNLFPKFEIKNLPENAQTIAIIVEDPDAPMERPFVHLLAVNIPITGSNTIIDEESLLQGVLGINDFGNIGWGGPCPPHGHGIHHYHFKFFILDTSLPLNQGFNLNKFITTLEEFKNHIIGYGEVIGLYER